MHNTATVMIYPYSHHTDNDYNGNLHYEACALHRNTQHQALQPNNHCFSTYGRTDRNPNTNPFNCTYTERKKKNIY